MFIAYKNLGETPLECLERTRLEKGISLDVPMTYAGRLDPMAEGLMILLEGEECKEKETYTGLDKTYEFEILVGFETDTSDLLGLVTNSADGSICADSENFSAVLKNFLGTQEQSYPLYSSKTVDGKQLHTHAREGRADFVRPTHEVEIFSLVQTRVKTISKENLLKEITERISKVTGDFRQTEILERWNQVLRQSPQNEFQVFSCTLDCGSGTYVRQLISDIGKKLDVPMTTFSIKRTGVGRYHV